MPAKRTRLQILGMCAEGPSAYSELEMDQTKRMRREAALASLKEGATYCSHYSSIREILTSQDLERKIRSYSEGALVHIEYIHQVSEGTPQDPRNLWLRKMDPVKGVVTITNTEEDPWDTDCLLFLPDGASPFNPGPDMMDIYAALVISARAKERDFSDRPALD